MRVHAGCVTISPAALAQLLTLDEHTLSELITILASSKAEQFAVIDQLNDAQPSPLDDTAPEERAALERSLARAEEDIRAGRVYAMEQVMAELRAKHASRRRDGGLVRGPR